MIFVHTLLEGHPQMTSCFLRAFLPPTPTPLSYVFMHPTSLSVIQILSPLARRHLWTVPRAISQHLISLPAGNTKNITVVFHLNDPFRGDKWRVQPQPLHALCAHSIKNHRSWGVKLQDSVLASSRQGALRGVGVLRQV